MVFIRYTYFVRAKAVVKQINKLGGRATRQRGSHLRMEANTPEGDKAYVTIPMHSGKELPIGTLKSIEKALEPAFGKGWLTK